MRSALIAFVIATTLLAWVSGVTVMADTAQRNAGLLHDRELKQVATLLLGLSAHELQELGPQATMVMRIGNGRVDTGDTLGEDYRYQVWSGDGQLQLTNFGQPSAAAMARLGASGFSWLQMDGESWRVYAMHDPASAQEIQVAERAVLRDWVIVGADGSHVALVAVSFVIVLLPALWLLARLLRPLRELARALGERSPTNLEPVAVDRAPVELGPVVSAVNRLLSRVGDAIRRESQFTSLAAHELRTPLATVRMLADEASQAPDESQRARALRQLIVSVDLCSNLQDQLLTLSRLDTADSTDMHQSIDITMVVMDTLSAALPKARGLGIKLASQLDGSTISGHPFGVLTMMRNLVSNAVRHTPAGGRVEVTTVTRGSDVVVCVDDSGPGIPLQDRERVFERFVRLQRDRATGVGLGLSIVRVVAEAHGANIRLLDSPLGGLRAEVTFSGRALGHAADWDCPDVSTPVEPPPRTAVSAPAPPHPAAPAGTGMPGLPSLG
jgi:signal transduction histidine kinase